MDETAPVWYIRTGDRIRLDDKEVEVLDKNLVPWATRSGSASTSVRSARPGAPGNSSVGTTKSPASTTEKTTAASMCPDDEKFTRVIEVQE